MADVGDQREVTSKKKKFELHREQEVEDMKKLLETSSGRYLIWRLLEKCNMFTTLSGHDTEEMHRKSGARDIGLWIISEVETAKRDGYLDLVKESWDREDYHGGN